MNGEYLASGGFGVLVVTALELFWSERGRFRTSIVRNSGLTKCDVLSIGRSLPMYLMHYVSRISPP
jgi:hypothetical protein